MPCGGLFQISHHFYSITTICHGCRRKHRRAKLILHHCNFLSLTLTGRDCMVTKCGYKQLGKYFLYACWHLKWSWMEFFFWQSVVKWSLLQSTVNKSYRPRASIFISVSSVKPFYMRCPKCRSSLKSGVFFFMTLSRQRSCRYESINVLYGFGCSLKSFSDVVLIHCFMSHLLRRAALRFCTSLLAP